MSATIPAQPHTQELRERAISFGTRPLSDVELLRLLGVSRTVPGARGGIPSLSRMDAAELATHVGTFSATRLLAAFELGRRALAPEDQRPRLRTPAEIHAYLAPSLGALRREVFHVLCLNARNTLVRDARVAEGTMNACPVDPREVFAVALLARASAIVLAHNHPSGDPEPSAQDVQLTRHLAQGAELLGIYVLDHLVIGDGTYVSLLERGQLR